MTGSGTEKGMSIFLDVFRRADKNDDNCLSMDEFHSFFSDGVLKSEELEELFNKIDTHNSNNIDTGELCTYFANHLGPFQDIFGALEDLTAGVSKSLQSTSKEYNQKSFFDQFTVRFLLKEVTTQLSSLEKTIDTAGIHLETEALKDRERPSHSAEETSTTTGSNAGRFQRRNRRQLSSQTSLPIEGLTNLTNQVDRLQRLIDELGTKVKINPVDEEQVSFEDDNLITIVSRKMSIIENLNQPFQAHLQTYIEMACDENGCLSLSVRSVKDTSLYTLYELWDSPANAERHLKSEVLTSFEDNISTHLSKPQERKSFNIPSNWVNAVEK